MSPKLATVEVAIGTDGDERTGVDAGGGIGPGQGGELSGGRRGPADGGELPPGEAALARGLKVGAEQRCGTRQAGRASNRGLPAKTRQRVLTLIRQKYSGDVATRFGPTLVAEHLASEDGLTIDHETLRRWMLAAGLWSRQRARSPYRQRRARKAHFGELVQLDGSFHAWYEARGSRRCLITMVDDATSRSEGSFGAEETIWAAAAVLRRWIEQHGVPLALYTDWKNVYVRAATELERAAGTVPLTQFGRMCARPAD